MSEEKRNADEEAEAGGSILDGARRIADDADEWFLSLARGLGRTARWTTGEAKLVAEAAVAAGRTTGRVTKQMLARMRLETDGGAPAPSAALTAALNELGQIVEECPGDDYSSLRKDKHFWRALSRLQKLRREARAAAAAAAGSRAKDGRRDTAKAEPAAAGPSAAPREAAVVPDNVVPLPRPPGGEGTRPEAARGAEAPDRTESAADVGAAPAKTAQDEPATPDATDPKSD